MNDQFSIAVCPGDGIGSEVIDQSVVARDGRFSLSLTAFDRGPIFWTRFTPPYDAWMHVLP